MLIIGTVEREKIAGIVSHARAHPVLFDRVRAGAVDGDPDVVKLADRKPGFERPRSQNVVFSGGFRAAFCVEQQPAGFCSHLSISVMGRAKKGMTPSVPAVAMICEEFGVPFPADKMWLEEFEPGEFAVNLVSLYGPAQEGRA